MSSTTIETTYKSMGLRAEKSVTTHILLENAYEDSLVPDVATVDYAQENLGPTRLRPIPGCPLFVDDFYEFGYLARADVVERKGNVLATEDAAKRIVGGIHAVLRMQFAEYLHTAIVYTARAESKGKIASTIEHIEQETGDAAKNVWKKQEKDIFGYFVAKVDVSTVEMEELSRKIVLLWDLFENAGMEIYCIDYTQDFSGTLDRKKLVDYLLDEGYKLEGSEKTIEESIGTILDNTASAGNNTCSFVQKYDDKTIRCKFYNKIVCNFEAGEVREQFGGHLAEYVLCPNKKLREEVLHPDVQERGMCRVEISLYACNRDEICATIGQDMVDDVLPLEDVFVVQPTKKQYELLAERLDRCCILADKPEKTIYMAWYARTGTRRNAGIVEKAKSIRSEKEWNKAVEFVASEFGFRMCEIFRIDILEKTKTGVVFGPLRMYTKFEDTKTILAPCRRPTTVVCGDPPTNILPPTRHVEWAWRDAELDHRVGLEKLRWSVQEMETHLSRRSARSSYCFLAGCTTKTSSSGSTSSTMSWPIVAQISSLLHGYRDISTLHMPRSCTPGCKTI